MSESIIEPREVAEAVERYVAQELAEARKYENRTPLDDSGVWSLHRLAANIFALGFAAGEQVADIRARGQRQRDRETDGSPT
ncbi:hypothetical protein K1W54_04795 [Micromonospora sp. CPCC 205371]|nr:hypothetical protein [Micromonospora sp. CPCC 205371]